MKDELTALQNKSKALKDSDLLSIQDDFRFGFHNRLVLGFIRGGRWVIMSSSFPKSHHWSSEGGRMRARWLIRLR